MKTKKNTFIFLLLSLTLVMALIFSCDDSKLDESIETGEFWAIDLKKNSYYKVSANLLAKGTYCDVWVEKNCGITVSQAKDVANVYDGSIYHKMIEAFSIDISYDILTEIFTSAGTADLDNDTIFNTMEFADWLTDRDGKLCILLLDIRDNYDPNTYTAYYAGYFSPTDFGTGIRSNMRDMIYIDTYPGMLEPQLEDAYKTLSHEMQHLMNLATSYITRSKIVNSTRTVYTMDLWINEGLSSAAEWLYAEKHLEDRVVWFNKNGGGNGLIDMGNNFFVWDNREDESDYANLDDYSTVYLFFQWLRLHSGNNGMDTYRRIITSNNVDYKAVTSAAAANINSGYSSWETLLGDWLSANYINAPVGPYGYLNETLLKNVKTPPPSSGSIDNTILLAPGEGVYSVTNNAPDLSNQDINIKNLFLNDTANTSHVLNSILLTFNMDSNHKGSSRTGVTTGIPLPQPQPQPNAGSVSLPRSLLPSAARPYRMDPGVHFRQMGNNE